MTSEALPSVTVVFLVYNRREELRASLREMLYEADFPADRLDVIVVDNASQDGSAEMVRDEFPQVQLIRREENVGVSGWNDGFAAARGDWVLALDDDCYVPGDGLRRALEAALANDADLVSFAVESSFDPSFRFDHVYRTGLFTFWGCAVLMRREVLHALTGYDPGIFVWANELEFTLRFYDAGFRHLHMPEVHAVHMKEIGGHWSSLVRSNAYRVNARHFAYIAARLFAPRDALEALLALVLVGVRDALSVDRVALAAARESIAGFVDGLRNRAPLRDRRISRFYRHNFESFASPWWTSRPLAEIVRSLPRELSRALTSSSHRAPEPVLPRRDLFFAERAGLYPSSAATLDFRQPAGSRAAAPAPAPRPVQLAPPPPARRG